MMQVRTLPFFKSNSHDSILASVMAIFVRQCLLWAGIVCCLPVVAQDPGHPFVTEIAPGVFMRDLNGIYGANQVFIVFDEYVVVFDASRVDQARLLDAEIRARVNKPVRYVIHSHFHPDHSAGAAVFASEDVEIIAGADDLNNYEVWGPNDFATKTQKSPQLYRGLRYPAPNFYVKEQKIFDDGNQRLEVIHFGHGHTAGDLIGWLPKYGILLTGDVAENRCFNNLANASVIDWISVLQKLRALPVQQVVPGHGHLAGPEILEMTQRFLIEFQNQVGDMVRRGMSHKEVERSVSIPFYEEWTGTRLRNRPNSIAVVYRQAGGVIQEPMITKKRLLASGLVFAFVAGLAAIQVLWRRFSNAKCKNGTSPSD